MQAHKEESSLSIDSVVLKIDGVFFKKKNAKKNRKRQKKVK